MTDSPGSPLSITQLAQRNVRIARARAEGEAWKVIAAREGLSVRQAARAGREHLAATVPASVANPLDVAALVVRTHVDSLATLSRLAGSRNAPTALGAAARAPGVAVSLLDVSQRVGLAPAPVSSWTFLRDLPQIAAALLAAAERAGANRDVLLRELGVGLDAVDATELAVNLNVIDD